MRHLNILILSILSIQLSVAQINEIGGFLGGSNFIGDVGATDYIAPNAPALGLLYKWNRSARHAYKVSIIYSDLKASDLKSEDPRRLERGFVFNSNLLELSAGMEFSFFDFNLHSGKTLGTPYLYSGVTAAKHGNYFFNSNRRQIALEGSSWAFGIPIGLGFKTNILGTFILSFEVGARYTFSDNIDGSIPEGPQQQFKYGNLNNNDWYVLSGLSLTYTFGEKPCYCN